MSLLSPTTGRRGLRTLVRITATGAVGALAAAGLAAPARAADHSIPAAITVVQGESIRLSGTGWKTADGTAGSILAFKLDDGAISTKAEVKHPVTGAVQANKTIYALAQADTTGSWSVEMPFPTIQNADKTWEPGAHSVRILTGSMLAGDQPRTVAVPVTVVAPPPPVAAGVVTIGGTPRVGSPLTAQPGTWTPGATLTYRWTASGAVVSTARSYTPSASLRGRSLAVTVTGTKVGLTPTTVTSRAVTVAAGRLSAQKPRIAGKAKVGKVLKVKAGAWTPGTRLSYRWYAGSKAVKGRAGTRAALKLTAKMRGARISVRVTGSKAGYTTTTAASKRTAKVRK